MDVTNHPRAHSGAGSGSRSGVIRAAAHRALAARDRVVAGYPQWETWRRQARASKTEALARLDELLEALARSVTAWGGRVLWARDAAQARELILQVAREHRVKKVVKSKSMTTEEIGLNPALAAAGLETVETDLGEFIIQLAGHPPAHLTAPALHLNRFDIADILATHLSLRVPAEPEALSRRTTAYLQPHFFEAQMGITGVNFATPEGTLVLVENESNLRFTATLPPVHVAVMGLEKMIPRLGDLAVMLRLLPASATGQRLTALVHFIRGLKFHPGGEQAFYLVILDNGRRRLAADPDLAEALYCLRCGACLNICPIFQVGAAHLYGRVYPGAIGILLAPFLAPAGDMADLCAQCGACQEICPVGIRLAEKIRLLRGHSRRFRRMRVLTGAAAEVLSRPGWYRGLEEVTRGLAGFGARHGRQVPGLGDLAPESFHRQARPRGGEGADRGKEPATPPGAWFSGQATPEPATGEMGTKIPEPAASRALLAQRLQEAGSGLAEVRGPGALARRLAAEPGHLRLEDHAWLEPVAGELAKLGVKYQMAGGEWAPAAGTVVSVARGAIPETGSVLVDGGEGVGAALAFRAEKQIILIPPDRAGLSLAEALATGPQAGQAVTWLTGASRTADIEKVLVMGAQGPKELEMIVYQEEG